MGLPCFFFLMWLVWKFVATLKNMKLVRNFIILRISKELLSVIKDPVLTYYLLLRYMMQKAQKGNSLGIVHKGRHHFKVEEMLADWGHLITWRGEGSWEWWRHRFPIFDRSLAEAVQGIALSSSVQTFHVPFTQF